eukprot:5682140-Amphidinium_carterae.1
MACIETVSSSACPWALLDALICAGDQRWEAEQVIADKWCLWNCTLVTCSQWKGSSRSIGTIAFHAWLTSHPHA